MGGDVNVKQDYQICFDLIKKNSNPDESKLSKNQNCLIKDMIFQLEK